MSDRIVCLGEVLLRLSAPGRELLLQSSHLAVCFGGSEANVAVSLARFGHAVAMATVVPDNPLGEAAIGELRRHGVDTSHVLTLPGRMGLYFLVTGAIHRASEVLYDRSGSAFSIHAGALDTESMLNGADALHVSGITAALGMVPAAAAKAAMKAARARRLAVSFDFNYRARLWGGANSDAPRILKELAGLADTLFCGSWDLALILGQDFGDSDSNESFSKAGAAAFAAFPLLQRIATIVRLERSVDNHELSARMLTRTRQVTARNYAVGTIVDRIGAGDAFAAGVLHGLRSGMQGDEILQFGLAAACLKHSIPGDFNLVTEADVRALTEDAKFTVKR